MKGLTILIVEDEKLAFDRLNRLLKNLEAHKINSVSHANSVQQAINILKQTTFDLLFFDIELSDGLSFEILEQVEIQSPIIFTTAYNQYAIEAFKHNSVDYLLKPIESIALAQALEKFNTVWKKDSVAIDEQKLLLDFKNLLQDNYKKRFTVKIGEHIRIIETADIQLVYSKNKGTYIRTNKDSLIDFSLDKMEQLLSPKHFFRISRQYIVALNAIKDIVVFSNSRLKIVLVTAFEDEIIVSREKVQKFKRWIEGE